MVQLHGKKLVNVDLGEDFSVDLEPHFCGLKGLVSAVNAGEYAQELIGVRPYLRSCGI